MQAKVSGTHIILFLDFDGVLHPVNGNEGVFCRLPLLWEILDAIPNAAVVFSTSWREKYSIEEMIEFVTGGEEASPLRPRFIGRNPVSAHRPDRCLPFQRERECRLWLNQNGYFGARWMAIDDTSEEFSATGNVYSVDSTTGLTSKDVTAIVRRVRSVER